MSDAGDGGDENSEPSERGSGRTWGDTLPEPRLGVDRALHLTPGFTLSLVRSISSAARVGGQRR